MIQFKYQNYFAHYTSKGTNNIRSSKNEVCFAQIFRYDNKKVQDNIYHVYVYPGTKMLQEYNKDNNCLLSQEELSHHLSIIKQIMPFTYRITSKTVKYNGAPIKCFVVMMHVKGYNIKHRFILTWLRYAYEFPYNIITKEAYKVRREPGFKSISIFNLIQLIGESSALGGFGGHAVSSFSLFHNLISNKALTAYLNNSNNIILNGILSDIDVLKLKDRNTKFKTIYAEERFTLEYWESEIEYKNRLEIYKHNYEIKKRYGKKIK